ncbi:MAG: glycoside hydrolase family 16 protein [Crocinitomicaceae bacterium]|nr:glycoside hydrolase family 16 protein [Crocinitomicaceae bacterium]
MKFFSSVLIILLVSYNYAQTPKRILEDYELIWQDEFEGNSLDTSKWLGREVGVKRGVGIVRRENTFLDGEGHLIIEATKVDSTYFIGQIATFFKHEFTYGYFESSVQLNKVVGPSTAFWLQSLTYGKHIGDPGRSGTEIDILEYRRKYRTNEIHHTIHWDGYGTDHQQHGNSPIHKGIEEGFHTFGLEWTPKQYIFYVDGKVSWKTKKSVSQAPQYIILSVEMNNWSGDPSNSTFPDKAVYDYVRVYQKKSKEKL